MNTQSDPTKATRHNLLEFIEDLNNEMESKQEFIHYRSDLNKVIINIREILSENDPDLQELSKNGYGIFRMVTDEDFQHTALGMKFLELVEKIGQFVREKN